MRGCSVRSESQQLNTLFRWASEMARFLSVPLAILYEHVFLPQVANFPALCRELTGTSFGELSRHAAEDVLKNYPVEAAVQSAKHDRSIVAGIDLGIIHPYAV